MKIVWFLAFEEFSGGNTPSIVLISSSESVDTTFRHTFGGFRSFAGLVSINPSATSQLKKARRVRTWPWTVAAETGSAFSGVIGCPWVIGTKMFPFYTAQHSDDLHNAENYQRLK